jgi:hypothetical protein
VEKGCCWQVKKPVFGRQKIYKFLFVTFLTFKKLCSSFILLQVGSSDLTMRLVKKLQEIAFGGGTTSSSSSIDCWQL